MAALPGGYMVSEECEERTGERFPKKENFHRGLARIFQCSPYWKLDPEEAQIPIPQNPVRGYVLKT